MSQAYDFDLVTIGAGSGGVRASRFSAQQYGVKVACIELPFGFISSDEIGGAGGTCVIRGCVPKKLLVYGAHYREEFEDAVGFGWGKAVPTHDWKTLISNKAAEIERLNGIYKSILKNAGVEQIEGRGRLLDPHTVEVTFPDGNQRTITGKNILIATGSYATKIPVEGKEHAITSDEALSLDLLPEKDILIFGAGYIATEFAGIFRGIGLNVHLVFRGDKVLRGFDEECRDQVMQNLQARGIHLVPKTNPKKIVKLGEEDYEVTLVTTEGEESVMRVGLVMMATGRKPRTKDLGLEAAGVQLKPDGAVVVDEFSRTSVPHIWALGDATERVALTPVAIMEAMAFAHTAFGPTPVAPNYKFIPSAVFCNPPLATVGWSEELAVEQLGGELDIFTSRFKAMKNTISGREERVFMKLIVHKETDRVVGAHMVGPDAPEIMQGLAIALKCGATKAQFDSTVGIHPSAAEEFVTMRSKARTVTGTGTAKL